MRLLRRSAAHALLPVISVLGLISLLAVAASATETRVRSLGGDGDYFEDLANVPRWYGSLPSYANTAVLELGEFDAAAGADAGDQQAVRQGAGALLDLDAARRYGTLGLYIFRDTEAADGAGARLLMYGKAWTHAQVGLAVGGRTQRDLGQTLGEGVFGCGARLDLGERTYLDLAGDWRVTDYENGVVLGGPEFDRRSWGTFSLRARAFHAPRQSWALVPVFSYLRDDRWQPSESADLPLRQDAWQARYGLGVNLMPTGDVMGLVSCEYRQAENSRYQIWQGRDVLYTRLEYDVFVTRLGLEARLRPWCSLRAGVTSRGEIATGGFDDYFGLPDDFDLTLGLGLHLGDLDADFLFNDDAPFNLGSLVTNAGDGEAATFSSVSLAYRF